MAEEKKPAGASAKPSTAIPTESEESLRGKIEAIKTEIKTLDSEVKILEGRVRNRNSEKSKTFVAQNEALEKRMKRLAAALWALQTDDLKPRRVEDLQLHGEALRKSALRFFKETKINPELWKSIES